jgi:lipopolysaccharide assembly protein A
MLTLAIAAVLFAVSNRAPVALELWPLPFALDVPIYAVALATLTLGVVWGFLIGWWGTLRARRRARLEARRAADLEQDLRHLNDKIAVLEHRPVAVEPNR